METPSLREVVISYNPNIPTGASKRAISQRQIQANFQAIQAAFAENHVPLTSSRNIRGMHNVLKLQPQGGAPVTSASQIALYNQLVATIPNLFFAPSSAQTPIQLTYPSILVGIQSTNPTVYYPAQYSFVAGPFVVYMGKVHNPTIGQTVTVTPATTLRYVGLTRANIGSLFPLVAEAIPTNIVGASFDITYQAPMPPSDFDVYYLAIGN